MSHLTGPTHDYTTLPAIKLGLKISLSKKENGKRSGTTLLSMAITRATSTGAPHRTGRQAMRSAQSVWGKWMVANTGDTSALNKSNHYNGAPRLALGQPFEETRRLTLHNSKVRAKM